MNPTARLGLLLAGLLLTCWFCTSQSKPASLQEPEDERAPLSPLTDQARKLWNNAKKTYRRMVKEHHHFRVKKTVSNQQTVAEVNEALLANVTGSKYIKDLYRNLTNSSTSMPTQANTIRSLPISKTFLSCGQYNFSLEPVNSTEFILQAELHLYLDPIPNSQDNYIVMITEKTSERTIPKEVAVAGTTRRYITFNVEELVRPLVAQGESYAFLELSIFKDLNSYMAREKMACTELKFTYDDFTEEDTPLLVVYSYDPKLKNINYQAIAKRTLDEVSTTGTPVTTTRKRRRRSINSNSTIPGCTRHSLWVKGSKIFPELVGKQPGDTFEVVIPDQYDAGICGGGCSRTFPVNAPSNHAPFIHVLLGISDFIEQQNNNFNYTECCAPVEYTQQDVLARSATGVAIHIIPNMKITKCECIYIADFS